MITRRSTGELNGPHSLPADELLTRQPLHEAQWLPFASFVIEFQIGKLAGYEQGKRLKVHHIEADTCATWPDFAVSALCQWLVGQLRL